ncbi:phenylacetate--CoA ligase family protein [Shimia sp. MMG029]|uniref:phenylacetate--CoA ligase family protein n=1 Tax=Shimia sp. MMG029 TaxID=3021978 RepID=UPI0022FF123F|nr:AMP-binding protein [Shimia sp. MMG029]MDA5557631.1 AMP-binding protein [Shimia sp. MMG029]
MSRFFDELETRSADQRAADLSVALPAQLARAKALPGFAASLANVDPAAISSAAALADLPVLRKSELGAAQKAAGPLGGFADLSNPNIAHVFQSPGPIYEPGGTSHDWFRFGRVLHAVGIGADDIVQNCFSYHLTPAGMMFESGARAVGAKVLPAGVGQTEMQVRAAVDIGTTAYAGTPDYLKIILDKAEEMGEKLQITKATVGGGALFPSLRQEYADRGITCLQGYGTADLGSIAYESDAMEGMIIDEGVIVEIVTPGTGTPVAPGEVGEVVVTTLNPDYPLIRFATGDLSAILPGESPCGRTNMRIKGWMGRADQTAKIKGMFVRPEQVAALVAKHDEIAKARVIATRAGEMDVMTVQIESPGGDAAAYGASVVDALKLKGTVEIVAPGSLPKDGIVIEDQRKYD